jgi:catechol 2,3-dioxygenase-like lactoylglutathione lyase family enzyme
MRQYISPVAFVVRDYEEAIEFFVGKLNFELVEDTSVEARRWVLVRPPGAASPTCLLLAKASTPAQRDAVGNQAGGRVFLFLNTDDFWRDYDAMTAKGIVFVRPPKREAYGTVAVFEDLYGNRWDLIQPSVE